MEKLNSGMSVELISMLCSATCIWSAVTNTWWHLFIARFFLGIGIGPKSATVPVYAAEVRCGLAPFCVFYRDAERFSTFTAVLSCPDSRRFGVSLSKLLHTENHTHFWSTPSPG